MTTYPKYHKCNKTISVCIYCVFKHEIKCTDDGDRFDSTYACLFTDCQIEGYKNIKPKIVVSEQIRKTLEIKLYDELLELVKERINTHNEYLSLAQYRISKINYDGSVIEYCIFDLKNELLRYDDEYKALINKLEDKYKKNVNNIIKKYENNHNSETNNMYKKILLQTLRKNDYELYLKLPIIEK